MSAKFLLVCFVSLKESTCKTKENVFFISIISYCSWDNQSLTFQIFKCHDFIKCLSMKHKHVLPKNLESKQSGNEIFLIHVIKLQKKDFYQKFLWKMWPGN